MIFFLTICYCRFSLWLPAAALDKKLDLRDTFALTRGNGVRLALILIITGLLAGILDSIAISLITYASDPLSAIGRLTQNLLRNFPIQLLSSVRYERGARCVSSDRVPVIGEFSKNCWISNAHGSLGTSSAPLAASIISSNLLGWIPPITGHVEKILVPHRFKERQNRRGELKSTKSFIK